MRNFVSKYILDLDYRTRVWVQFHSNFKRFCKCLVHTRANDSLANTHYPLYVAYLSFVTRGEKLYSKSYMTARKFRTVKGNEIGKKPKNKRFKLNFRSQIRKRLLLTVWRPTTHIYKSYRTSNLQTLHFIYLFNKYRYWIF